MSFWSTGGEWTDSARFALCTILCHMTFPVGLMIMSGVAYLIQDWRILQLVLFCPLVVLLAVLYWSVSSQTSQSKMQYFRF